MKLEELKILAMTEFLLIWDRVASTGCTKKQAIQKLFYEGAISDWPYSQDCPFCHYLRIRNNCSRCLWPGYNGRRIGVRCQNNANSPYNKYRDAITGTGRAQAGQEVLEMLLGIEF